MNNLRISASSKTVRKYLLGYGISIEEKYAQQALNILSSFAKQKALILLNEYSFNDLLSEKNNVISEKILSVYTDISCTIIQDSFISNNKDEINILLMNISSFKINKKRCLENLFCTAYVHSLLKEGLSYSKFIELMKTNGNPFYFLFFANEIRNYCVEQIPFFLESTTNYINAFFVLFNYNSLAEKELNFCLNQNLISDEEIYEFVDQMFLNINIKMIPFKCLKRNSKAIIVEEYILEMENFFEFLKDDIKKQMKEIKEPGRFF